MPVHKGANGGHVTLVFFHESAIMPSGHDEHRLGDVAQAVLYLDRAVIFNGELA